MVATVPATITVPATTTAQIIAITHPTIHLILHPIADQKILITKLQKIMRIVNKKVQCTYRRTVEV